MTKKSLIPLAVLLGVAVVLGGVAAVVGTRSDTNTAAQPVMQTSMVPEPVHDFRADNLTMAQQYGSGVVFNPIDLAKDIFYNYPKVVRPITDPSDWIILSQCDRITDGKLTVGVVKRSEVTRATAVQDWETTYTGLLLCNY